MHDHNKDSGGKGIIWMMIPCLLLFGALSLSGGKLSSLGYFWPLVGVFAIAHIWLMLKGRGGHSDDTSIKQPEIKDENNKSKHGGCCH